MTHKKNEVIFLTLSEFQLIIQGR